MGVKSSSNTTSTSLSKNEQTKIKPKNALAVGFQDSRRYFDKGGLVGSLQIPSPVCTTLTSSLDFSVPYTSAQLSPTSGAQVCISVQGLTGTQLFLLLQERSFNGFPLGSHSVEPLPRRPSAERKAPSDMTLAEF